jgi:hypothetical protein
MKFAFGYLIALTSIVMGVLLSPAAEPQPSGAKPSAWTGSTNDDDYERVLGIRTNMFGGTYTVDQPIPVSVEIFNFGPKGGESKHPTAQLFPHLDVVIELDGNKSHHTIPLDIENRLWIDKGEKFDKVFDLKDVVPLDDPGEYRISLGHLEYVVLDLGDWTGTLMSPDYVVRIVPADNETVNPPTHSSHSE